MVDGDGNEGRISRSIEADVNSFWYNRKIVDFPNVRRYYVYRVQLVSVIILYSNFPSIS